MAVGLARETLFSPIPYLKVGTFDSSGFSSDGMFISMLQLLTLHQETARNPRCSTFLTHLFTFSKQGNKNLTESTGTSILFAIIHLLKASRQARQHS